LKRLKQRFPVLHHDVRAEDFNRLDHPRLRECKLRFDPPEQLPPRHARGLSVIAFRVIELALWCRPLFLNDREDWPTRTGIEKIASRPSTVIFQRIPLTSPRS